MDMTLQEAMDGSRETPLTREAVAAALATLPVAVPETALSPLTAYLALLMQWNAAINLVGPSHWETALHTLIADSFFLADFLAALPLPAHPQCWDVGAGAGLPGIPLRMVWREGDYTMVEAREKRALFLRTALACCGLERTYVKRGRAEHVLPAAGADLLLSRAFMPWREMLSLASSRLTEKGLVVLLLSDPLPSVPTGWTTSASRGYACAGHRRCFWALRRSGT
jgi:16S rRNA (guanine527-N7)-methyltransferase